jgi:hypothetical protein
MKLTAVLKAVVGSMFPMSSGFQKGCHCCVSNRAIAQRKKIIFNNNNAFRFSFQFMGSLALMPQILKMNFSIGDRKSSQVLSFLKTLTQYRPKGMASNTVIIKRATIPDISAFMEKAFKIFQA